MQTLYKAILLKQIELALNSVKKGAERVEVHLSTGTVPAEQEIGFVRSHIEAE